MEHGQRLKTVGLMESLASLQGLDLDDLRLNEVRNEKPKEVSSRTLCSDTSISFLYSDIVAGEDVSLVWSNVEQLWSHHGGSSTAYVYSQWRRLG